MVVLARTLDSVVRVLIENATRVVLGLDRYFGSVLKCVLIHDMSKLLE